MNVRVPAHPAVLLCALALVAAAPSLATAATGNCPNEQFRIGRSATLPDCRAYELVTPAELGRTGDLAFQGGDFARSSEDGGRLLLDAEASFLEPSPGVEPFIAGTIADFSRTPEGWLMKSAVTPAIRTSGLDVTLFSPDLSHIVLASGGLLPTSAGSFLAGPLGGPYATIVSGPDRGAGITISGANAGAGGVPAMSDVVFEVYEQQGVPLAPGSAQRSDAEETEPGARNLYEWSGGTECGQSGSSCTLVNVNDKGELLNHCGAGLGRNGGQTGNAISPDGSRLVMTSPESQENRCKEAPQLYMRVDGRETLDLSEPQGLEVPVSQRGNVEYMGANADDSRVFFTSPSALTPQAVGQISPHLYEYDTEAPEGHRLTLVGNAIAISGNHQTPGVTVAENSLIVYYEGAREVPGHGLMSGLFAYNSATGSTSFVAVPQFTRGEGKPAYVTPNGDFLIFPSGSGGTPGPEITGPHGLPELVEESRGAQHEEIYRYDALTGSTMCVSCGEGKAPAQGETPIVGDFIGSLVLETADSTWVPRVVSEDGRRVFFETTSKLVPQDGNESSPAEEVGGGFGNGTDVYEWEEEGTEEAPGAFCRVANGCTHLISAGEAVGPEALLGASEDGKNVFFTSAAELVSWATPEYTNLYDARVDGGFPPPKHPLECTSCQGAGSPPPTFGAPDSLTFIGPGNPALPAQASGGAKTGGKTAKAKCAKGKRRIRGRCVRAKAKRTRRASKRAVRGRHR